MTRKKCCSWIVLVRKVVDVEMVCEGCTEEQATEFPLLYAVDERHVETRDWESISVKPNI